MKWIAWTLAGCGIFLFLAAIAVWAVTPWTTETQPLSQVNLLGTGLGNTGSISALSTWTGSLFSGLAFIGTLVVILYQRHDLKLQTFHAEDAERRRITLALYDEFHSEKMHRHRAAVVHYIRHYHTAKRDILKLSDIDRLRNQQAFDRDREEFFEQYRKSESRIEPSSSIEHDIWSMYHFFEKWSMLSSSNLLDHALADQYLGSYADWWMPSFIRKLEQGETNSDYVRVFGLIREHITVKNPQSNPTQW